MVLTALRWDVSRITPPDVLDYIVVRLPFTAEQRHVVRSHAVTFIVLCITGPSYTRPFRIGLLCSKKHHSDYFYLLV